MKLFRRQFLKVIPGGLACGVSLFLPKRTIALETKPQIKPPTQAAQEKSKIIPAYSVEAIAESTSFGVHSRINTVVEFSMKADERYCYDIQPGDHIRVPWHSPNVLVSGTVKRIHIYRALDEPSYMEIEGFMDIEGGNRH